jgi:hypothetical protein
MNRASVVGLWLSFAAAAAAQPELYGIRATGELVRLDTQTGAGTVIANPGVMPSTAWSSSCCQGAQGGGWRDTMIVPGLGADASRLSTVRIDTGLVMESHLMTGLPAGYRIIGFARTAPSSPRYVLLGGDAPGTPDLLGHLDAFATAITVDGPTGRTDMQAMTSADGFLYAVAGEGAVVALYVLDTSGAATLVGGAGTYADDYHALITMPGGLVFSAGSGLRSINLATGVATLVGPTGFPDLRGLSVATACYVDCSAGGPPPILNVLDFNCFLNMFLNGYPYANCDHSTTEPVLNVLDFNCFLNRFAGACQ